MKNRIILILAFSILVFISPMNLFAQRFPQSSTEGTMQMSGTVNDVDMPIVDLSIRAPDSNQEVAFSVQVMLLLTILSLAPSILILLTCFFSGS